MTFENCLQEPSTRQTTRVLLHKWLADKVIAGKQLYDKNCCCYYLEPWSVFCGVTLPNSAFHMPI
jgi:hypothetical protein